ncbi:ABC transporter substrate-binding protein [Anaerosporobacter sp.]|uniref:ABC transporter substrate-binding protein n=1 Tax=Anaerosporobacter sp. TaxID=1872529 RepID=UPI00286F4E29|nr:ABC transporter substrate-binding protein [Anaerosporobacter sp.]
MKKHTKYLSYILILTSLLLLITGCSNKSTPSSTATEHDKTNVVIAISSEPTTLDPCIGCEHGTTPLIQSTLVEYNQDMTFTNDLATDYTVSDDGLTWSFTIRNDVTFTDGEPLTASDVAFTFNNAKAIQSTLDLTFMDYAVATSDYTVIFTLNRPTSTFLNTIAITGIVPEHAYNENYGTAPIGSGPFMFVQWNKGEQLMLKANENYYGTVPSIKNITIVFMTEDAAFAATKAGQVDVALTSATLATTDISGYYLKTVTSLDNRGFTLPLMPNEGKTTESGFPYGNNVTCNLEIRHALAYGIDREQIAKVALNGFADPAYSENDGMPWNNSEVIIDTDKEYAKKLLANNGWVDTDHDGIVEKDGLKAEFTCIYPAGDSFRQAVALAASTEAKELGINIIVEGTSWDDISKRMFCDAVLMGWGSSNPYTSYCLYHSDNMLQDDYYNPEGYSNKAVDSYLDAAMKSLTPEDAYENWKKAQWDGSTGTAMKGDCPWVWLVNMHHLYYVRKGLDIGNQQLHPHGDSMPLLQNLRNWTWTD